MYRHLQLVGSYSHGDSRMEQMMFEASTLHEVSFCYFYGEKAIWISQIPSRGERIIPCIYIHTYTICHEVAWQSKPNIPISILLGAKDEQGSHGLRFAESAVPVFSALSSGRYAVQWSIKTIPTS